MKLLATLCALFFSTVLCSASVDKIVVFGDSLSDNGNLYEYMKHKFPMSPPYAQGRFTNGPVWIELVTSANYPGEENAHLLDYAFGGAGILKDEDDDGTLFTLKNEIDTFMLAHEGKADPNALYVVWIGSNNYLGMPDEIDETVNLVINGIDTGIKRLVNAGAKHIFLVNIPDLGKTPAARDLDAVPLLSLYSAMHNERILQRFSQYKLDYPQVDWIFFDIDAMLTEVFTNPESLGFSNVKGTCYEAVLSNEKPSILKMVASIQPKSTPDACTGFLFFDPVHPAGLAHELIAQRAQQQLKEANIEFVKHV
jgi:phospholipase/lecithinase/hemolysin